MASVAGCDRTGRPLTGGQTKYERKGAAGAGGFVAFQGAVADVFAFHPRQCGRDGEHDAGGVVGALQFAGEEVQSWLLFVFAEMVVHENDRV